MAPLSLADALRLELGAKELLSFGLDTSVETGETLSRALANDPEEAKDLFKSKRSIEANIVRHTYKALESLAALEKEIQAAGIMTPLPEKNKKKKKAAVNEDLTSAASSRDGNTPLSGSLLLPPEVEVPEPLPLAEIKPYKSTKAKSASKTSKAPRLASFAALADQAFPSFSTELWKAPEVVQVVTIYRLLGRVLLFFPRVAISATLWSVLIVIILFFLCPRVVARAIYHMARHIPGLMWGILQEFGAELEKQFFGSPHCPESCLQFESLAPPADGWPDQETRGPRINSTQQAWARLPTHQPPAQPPGWACALFSTAATYWVMKRAVP